jgi:hypothetical protein
MRTLDTWKFALAAAVAVALLNAACAVALVIAPDATIAIFSSFMHGIDLTTLIPPGGRPVTLGQVVIGVFNVGAIGFVGGATLAGCYNLLVAWNGGQEMPHGRERST